MNKTPTVLITILALTFYLRLLYFGQYIDADVGNAGYQAWRLAEGEVVIDLEGPGKPPLYPMLYAVFIRLFGISFFGLKMFGTFFVLMAVLAVFWLAKQACGRQVGLLAAFLFGVFSSGPMVEGGTVNLETVLHLPSILAVSLFLKASLSGRLRWYFLAGLCAALAMLVKQVGGVLFFVFLCCGIPELWRKKDSRSLKQWFARYLLLAAGALLPVIAVISFYHFHGYTLNQLYDSMWGSNLRYIYRGQESTSLLKFFSLSLKIMLPENGLLWMGTLFSTVYLGWRILHGKGQASDRILLWWALWSFAVLWLAGLFFQHYFLQIIAPFSVLTAYAIVTTWRLAKSLPPLPRSVAQAGITVLLMIVVIVFIRNDYKYFFSYTPVEQTVLYKEISDGIYDSYGVYNVLLQEIAYYIRMQTGPGEIIYVWGIAPQIYFLAQRKAATRYRNNYNLSALVTGNSLKALEAYAPVAIEEIRKSKPTYIVQIFPLDVFPALQTFVRDHYLVDKSVAFPAPPNEIRIYRRQ